MKTEKEEKKPKEELEKRQRKFVVNIKEVLPNKQFVNSNTKYIELSTAKKVHELLNKEGKL